MAKRKAARRSEMRQRARPIRKRRTRTSISAKASSRNSSLLRLANRHGLITGATGTGKTVTLQGLAEGFSDQGVPVFCADVKGDLSGIAEKGEPKPWIEERDEAIGFKQEFQRLSGDLLGPVRRTGPPDSDHRHRHGAASAVAPHGSERRAGGGAQYRLQDRRRGGICRSSHSRTCRPCSRVSRRGPTRSPPNTATSPRRRSDRSSVRSSCSSSKAANISSASRSSTSKTSCKPRAGRAISACSPPTG